MDRKGKPVRVGNLHSKSIDRRIWINASRQTVISKNVTILPIIEYAR